MNNCDCNEKKPQTSCGMTPEVVEIVNEDCPTLFHKMTIPASLGDDTGPYAPKNGAYKNLLVVYEANNHVYLYSSDGVYTLISEGRDVYFDSIIGRPKYAGYMMTSETDIPDVDSAVAAEAALRESADRLLQSSIDNLATVARTGKYSDLIDTPTVDTALDDTSTNAVENKAIATAITNEANARSGTDQNLQSQIDALAAASDVTDIVGTYAALQAYDTSKLKDNDIIKVLQDETHDDETTYYRWIAATSSFSLIGEEGPYYTKSAADLKFQDKLVAGSNITIDTDTNEISATDTTYTHFTGATASTDGTAGLVPAPTTADVDKFLKGDGTWGSASGLSDSTTFWGRTASNGKVGGRLDVKYSENDTSYVTINPTNTHSMSITQTSGGNTSTLVNFGASNTPATFYEGINVSNEKITNVATPTAATDAANKDYVDGLIPSDFTGTDGTTAGTHGLVPAPTTADVDKFLKSDGTWDTVGGVGIPTDATFWGNEYDGNSNAVDGGITMTKAGNSGASNYRVMHVQPENSLLKFDLTLNNYQVSPAPTYGSIVFSPAYRGSSSSTSWTQLGSPITVTKLQFQVGNRRITSVSEPEQGGDAATKSYVDSTTLSPSKVLAGNGISVTTAGSGTNRTVTISADGGGGANTLTDAEYNNLWSNA